ncbi:Hypothetical predicted protein [Octopus vulgaris]|uniref:Uncharacterized protein n=1 Tax=Octopus vulgaris TaxID=6645 RepID=A0AA36AXD8_OCTVU|nr:Hypothetical predicted protein [Octopus vulgaris]
MGNGIASQRGNWKITWTRKISPSILIQIVRTHERERFHFSGKPTGVKVTGGSCTEDEGLEHQKRTQTQLK